LGDRPQEDEDYFGVMFEVFESCNTYFMNDEDDDPYGDEIEFRETARAQDAVLRPMMRAAHVIE
jgi:hypothetical protein